MDKLDEILERCFKCKSYQEDDCGIYFMVALWQKDCKFFRSMKTKYQQYLEKCDVIDEDSFNKVVDSFPEFDIENVDIETIVYQQDIDELCKSIIDSILNNWRYAYCDEANFDRKTFDLEDVESLDDLEEINNYFLESSDWTIQNYEELKEDLEEEAKTDKESKEKERLLNIIKYNATTEELTQIIEEHGYKK